MVVEAKRAVLNLPGAACFAGILVAYSSLSGAQASGRSSDEGAIRTAIVQTTEAFNSHDASALARFYTSDADFVTVRGESMKGSPEIERGLAGLFATRNKHASLRTLDVRIRFIRPDVAVAHVTNELSGVLGAGGQRLPPQRELSIRVFVNDGGVWRVTAFHNSLVGGPPAPARGGAEDGREALCGASTPSNNQLQRTKAAQAMELRR
jgi:uncharacterized protein (TIGR02246 family)